MKNYSYSILNLDQRPLIFLIALLSNEKEQQQLSLHPSLLNITTAGTGRSPLQTPTLKIKSRGKARSLEGWSLPQQQKSRSVWPFQALTYPAPLKPPAQLVPFSALGQEEIPIPAFSKVILSICISNNIYHHFIKIIIIYQFPMFNPNHFAGNKPQ